MLPNNATKDFVDTFIRRDGETRYLMTQRNTINLDVHMHGEYSADVPRVMDWLYSMGYGPCISFKFTKEYLDLKEDEGRDPNGNGIFLVRIKTPHGDFTVFPHGSYRKPFWQHELFSNPAIPVMIRAAQFRF